MDEPVAWTVLVLDVVITTWWIAHREFKFRSNQSKIPTPVEKEQYMSSKLIVHTVATAKVEEEWLIEIDEGADINTHVWNGWEDAIEQGIARKIAVIQVETRDHEERQVLKVEAG